MSQINAPLALVLVGIICGFAIALIDPRFMRWLCCRGLAWAACVEAFKINRVREVKYWDETLGVAESREMLIAREDEA